MNRPLIIILFLVLASIPLTSCRTTTTTQTTDTLHLSTIATWRSLQRAHLSLRDTLFPLLQVSNCSLPFRQPAVPLVRHAELSFIADQSDTNTAAHQRHGATTQLQAKQPNTVLNSPQVPPLLIVISIIGSAIAIFLSGFNLKR